ncbi:MAG: 4-oxalocrotonate tautomerase [Clostridia bacterium]|jgi:4-oxalocrotonate tautomerase|nr:4-oxalocrotonate tautomerase [Clostridia bacterium]MBT7121595.1 4-oxalocrotonate tautomerase [Clostridia bacterium]
MPHIIVKLWPGRTEKQKSELTNRISQAVEETICADEKSISVSFEEVDSDKWMKQVYEPDILMKKYALYKKPGYGDFEDY